METPASRVRAGDRQLGAIRLHNLELSGESPSSWKRKVHGSIAVRVRGERRNVGAVWKVRVCLRIRAELQDQRCVGCSYARKLQVSCSMIGTSINVIRPIVEGMRPCCKNTVERYASDNADGDGLGVGVGLGSGSRPASALVLELPGVLLETEPQPEVTIKFL